MPAYVSTSIVAVEFDDASGVPGASLRRARDGEILLQPALACIGRHMQATVVADVLLIAEAKLALAHVFAGAVLADVVVYLVAVLLPLLAREAARVLRLNVAVVEHQPDVGTVFSFPAQLDVGQIFAGGAVIAKALGNEAIGADHIGGHILPVATTCRLDAIVP